MQKQRDKVIFLRTSQWIRCFLLVLVHIAVRWRPGRPPRPPHRAPSWARVRRRGGKAGSVASISGAAWRTSTPRVARGRRCACRPWAAASRAGSRWLRRRRTLLAALGGVPSGVLALPLVRSARHRRRTVEERGSAWRTRRNNAGDRPMRCARRSRSGGHGCGHRAAACRWEGRLEQRRRALLRMPAAGGESRVPKGAPAAGSRGLGRRRLPQARLRVGRSSAGASPCGGGRQAEGRVCVCRREDGWPHRALGVERHRRRLIEEKRGATPPPMYREASPGTVLVKGKRMVVGAAVPQKCWMMARTNTVGCASFFFSGGLSLSWRAACVITCLK
jgi:hypothetical protein